MTSKKKLQTGYYVIGTWTAGRKERYDRFSREVIEGEVYIQYEKIGKYLYGVTYMI
ncbi:MAG: hypothetical protein ACE5J9_09740 [Methanosarcinales archaeon]